MPNETKPHHRLAAAEALLLGGPMSVWNEWVENGTPPPGAEMRSIASPLNDLKRIAQAIADAEERGRQELPSPERLNRIQMPLPECEVTGRNLKHLMLKNGDALLYHGLAESESAALTHVLSGTRFRPTLVLEPIPVRAALEGKP